MSLRLDIGENADVRQVLPLGCVQVDDRDPVRSADAQEFLDARHDGFGHRQIARAARMHPDILHIHDDQRGIAHRHRPAIRAAAH
jgi:hypothetical protein